MARKLSSTTWIFIAFVPWIIFWSLSGAGLISQAITAALVVTLAVNALRIYTGNLKLMDFVSLGFFGLHFVLTVILESDLLLTWGRIPDYAVLAAMAWISIAAGSPFTYQYVRDDWPPQYWNDPLFLRTNNIIAVLWAAIFTADMTCSLALLHWPGQRLILKIVLPHLMLAAGIVFSVLFPRWYPRKEIIKEIDAWERPFKWRPPEFCGPRPEADDQFDVLVIGAGIGGLTAAALLARRGLKVMVIEQSHYVGGFCANFRRGRGKYVFDIGVHDISGLGPQGPVRWLLRRLDLEERIEFVRTCHQYILADINFVVPPVANQLVADLAALFPGQKKQVEEFFKEMHAVYLELYRNIEENGGAPRPPADPDKMMNFPATCPHIIRWEHATYRQMLAHYFDDARIEQLLMALTSYICDDPQAATVMQMAPIFGYYFDGGYYPKGGSGRFSQTLAESIKSDGGTILLRQEVVKIMVENGTACGVRLADGKILRARVIVSNADARKTLQDLVGEQHLPDTYVRQTLSKLQPTTSIAEVFLALDYEPPISSITIYKPLPDLELGLNLPSKIDPSLAPPGHHVMTLMAFVSQPEAALWKRTEADYKSRKAALAEKLIRQAEALLPDLRQHIVAMDAATPATITRYTGHSAGAIYGMSGVQNQRLPIQTPLRNLYLAGAGAWPGSGIEAVVISGILAANFILPD